MIEPEVFEDPAAFARRGAHAPLSASSPATAKAVLMVAPDGFRVSDETRADNRYMVPAHAVDNARAHRQHAALVRAIDNCLPVVRFRGDVASPDAVFPNNAFATVNGRLIVGAMRHPQRRLETQRRDIPRFFRTRLGYAVLRLDSDPACIAELTGALVIDRARRVGYSGLSERCNLTGAHAMHQAFGLARTLVFELAPGEYHANVVLAVLASRLLLICRESFADPAAADVIAAQYAPHVVWLDADEKRAYCGNAITLDERTAWFSARAAQSLRPSSRAQIEAAGFCIESVPLDEIEAAGGSLRCCIAEVF